jgi:hypothetical protein
MDAQLAPEDAARGETTVNSILFSLAATAGSARRGLRSADLNGGRVL